ncbi:MAG: DUF6320 domain-containing protein [Dysosmobacter sp.]|jgi:hypothetical protein|uniref:DUF6320 domain-containing protein n=1 Tax=Dysosmobacter sp. TaxID=2591382 RepID=UPI003D8E2CBD
MQYCPSCQMHIAGDKCCCPLCGGALEGKGDPQSEIFPRLTPTRSMARRVLRILALTGAAATAVCVLINLAMGTAVWWSLFVAGGVACGILTVAIGIAYRRDIPQNIAWETALVILLAILWDAATGWLGWSLDFVFPCACATGLLMEIALWGILKTPVHVVAGPMGGLGLAGLVPGVLVLVGPVNFTLPSLLCTAFSILFLAGLMLLRRRTAWGELRRRFHV